MTWPATCYRCARRHWSPTRNMAAKKKSITKKVAAKKVSKKAVSKKVASKKAAKKAAAKKVAKKATKKAAAKSGKKTPGKAAITAKALEIYLKRKSSGEPGDDMSDWLQAEKALSK